MRIHTNKSMGWIGLLFFWSLACILLPCSAGASEPAAGKTYKVGISEWTGYPDSVAGFKKAMARGGLIDGRNVIYLERQSGLSPSKQKDIAEHFKEEQVDLVYSLTTPGTLIMKQIMPGYTPIVFSIVTYPADSGLIESFEYSGNNLVGTSNYVELAKYISLLQIALPKAKSMAIFRKNGEPNSKIQAANIIRMAKKQSIQVIDVALESLDEVRDAALGLVGQVDVFMTTTDTLIQSGGEEALIEVSLEKKIPILSSNKTGIEQGSTFGIVADFFILGEMAGEMAEKILKHDIRPERLQSKIQDPPLTLINRKSAELLGVRIPEGKVENLRYIQ